MKRKMRVTLEIEVADLPDDVREELAADMDMGGEDLPCLADTEALTIADVLSELEMEGAANELFAGSEVFVQFTSVLVVGAEFIEPKP